MAQNNIPHFLCDYSAITIADKDAGITKITYSDTVEETPPNSPHKVVAFDFGRGPVPGYYVTLIQAEGAVIPDGSDVQVSHRRQGDEDTVCDTLRNVRQVRFGEYVCDWVYWWCCLPLSEAPDLYEKVTIHGKTFELAGPIEFHDHMVSIEIVLRRRQMVDFVTVAGDLIARSLSERRLIGVDAAALTAKGINQLVFVSRSIPIHRLQDDFVVRLEGVLLSDVDTLLRKQESDPCIAQQDDGDATEET